MLLHQAVPRKAYFIKKKKKKKKNDKKKNEYCLLSIDNCRSYHFVKEISFKIFKETEYTWTIFLPFLQGDNICQFLFAYLHTKSLLRMGLH